MAITEAYTGTAAISATEFSAPNNTTYAAGSVIAVAGVYQVFLDVSDLVVGDNLRIRIYEKCRTGDTTRVIYESYLVGIGESTWVSPSLVLMNGWDVTFYASAGTVTVLWSIRKVA